MAWNADIELTGSFVNLNQTTGLPTLTNFLIQNRSSKDIIVISAASEPIDLTDGIYIRPYEEFILPPSGDEYWVIGNGPISFQYYSSTVVDKAIRYYPGLTQPRLLTTILDQQQAFSLLGEFFWVLMTPTLADAAEQWYRFAIPNNTVTFGVMARNIMPNIAGLKYEVYFGTTGTTDGTELSIKTSNNILVKTPLTHIYQCSTPLQANRGTLYDSLLSGSGSGPATQRGAGVAGIEGGFVLYAPNSSVFVRILNTSGAINDVVAKVSFVEASSSIIINP